MTKIGKRGGLRGRRPRGMNADGSCRYQLEVMFVGGKRKRRFVCAETRARAEKSARALSRRRVVGAVDVSLWDGGWNLLGVAKAGRISRP